MENPLAVANYFIQRSFDTGVSLTPMKLVKLIYISHGWHLALTDKPLINEAIQAWKYGPVIQSIYHQFKCYGDGQITHTESLCMGNQVVTPCVHENQKRFLDKIWEVYSHYNGIELSSLTHQPTTPWYQIWHQAPGSNRQLVIIPNDLIKQHYKEKSNAKSSGTTATA